MKDSNEAAIAGHGPKRSAQASTASKKTIERLGRCSQAFRTSPTSTAKATEATATARPTHSLFEAKGGRRIQRGGGAASGAAMT